MPITGDTGKPTVTLNWLSYWGFSLGSFQSVGVQHFPCRVSCGQQRALGKCGMGMGRLCTSVSSVDVLWTLGPNTDDRRNIFRWDFCPFLDRFLRTGIIKCYQIPKLMYGSEVAGGLWDHLWTSLDEPSASTWSLLFFALLSHTVLEDLAMWIVHTLFLTTDKLQSWVKFPSNEWLMNGEILEQQVLLKQQNNAEQWYIKKAQRGGKQGSWFRTCWNLELQGWRTPKGVGCISTAF